MKTKFKKTADVWIYTLNRKHLKTNNIANLKIPLTLGEKTSVQSYKMIYSNTFKIGGRYDQQYKNTRL